MQITLTAGWYDAENHWKEVEVTFEGNPQDDGSSDDHQEINFANTGLPTWDRNKYTNHENFRIAEWLDEERDYVLERFIDQSKKEYADR